MPRGIMPIYTFGWGFEQGHREIETGQPRLRAPDLSHAADTGPRGAEAQLGFDGRGPPSYRRSAQSRTRSLYRTIQSMLRDGLTEEVVRSRDATADDERRRTYQIAALGRQVVSAEARRLQQLLEVARDERLIS